MLLTSRGSRKCWDPTEHFFVLFSLLGLQFELFLEFNFKFSIFHHSFPLVLHLHCCNEFIPLRVFILSVSLFFLLGSDKRKLKDEC